MDESHADGDGDSNQVAPALIAVQPSQHSVAVALGPSLRIFDLQNNSRVSLSDDSTPPIHSDSIRSLRFSSDGNLLASGGDDKLVKIWSSISWRTISVVRSEKRVSAIAITKDSNFICFADKFGAVWVADISEPNGKSLEKAPSSLLSHYCSIITSLEFSPNGKFIISADRDYKIRVTVFPKDPLKGAHEIQSFCLGHTDYVSCLAFISTNQNPSNLLLSGSGDSTVRLWDFESGCLLDTFNEYTNPITSLCTVPNSPFVAVSLSNTLKGITLLRYNTTPPHLSLIKVVSLSEGLIPTGLSAASSGGLLWVVSGVSKLNGGDNLVARLRVINGFNGDESEGKMGVVEDDEVPGSKELLLELQGSLLIDDDWVCEVGKCAKAALSGHFVKKQYSLENRELRKKTRNDKKLCY